MPFTVTAKVIPAGKPATFPAGTPKVVPAHLNVHTVPKDLIVFPVNKDSLKTFTPGIDTSSFVLLNSTGETIPTGVPIPVKGRVVLCIQPQPVKALPLRMKDNATMNLKFLDMDQGMNSSGVISILEDSRGNLWFGTMGGGICMFDGVTFTHFSEKEGLCGNDVRSMLEDSRGNLWFGTFGKGISMYDGTTFTQFTSQNRFASNVNSILEDRNGNLWFGTDNGVSMYDGLTFTHLTEKEGLTNRTIHSIMEDTHGHLWLGTLNGAYRYNGETLTHFSEKEGLSNNIVLSMLEDSRGYIWFGTAYGGVSLYHDESFTYFTEREGLSNNIVYSILEDLDHNIWLGTEKGLNLLVFDKEGDANRDTFNIPIIHTYGFQDGLKTLDFYSNSVLLDSKNRIWWGANNNLIMLDMKGVTIPIKSPDIQLDHIIINEQFADFRHLNENDRMELEFKGVPEFYNYPLNLKLPYKRNHLTFHFSAIDWFAQNKIKYSFKLEGFNDSWSMPSEVALADYRQLPPGTFTFKVKAIGAAQKWSESFEYTFIINPPWWQTWWARTGYAITILLIIFAYVRWRTTILKQRQKVLEAEIDIATLTIREQKEEVETQNEELETQRDLVVTQKNEIIDSISYSKRIQSAMLPPEVYVTELLNENFILYKPRDIVSGDFYWIKQVNQYIILAAADCTGHGVPGALMSMLGISHLNELRKQIKFALRQHGQPDEAKEGIDVALCVLDLKNMKMQYSGANNPLYLIRDVDDVPELIEIKADRMPIGFYQGKDKTFANHDIQLEIGDTFYIFSDGFIDQKGGENNKKFMSKNFKNLLLEIHDQPLYDQKEILNKTLSDWMGNNSQLDDILVIGVRV